ncbi:MAG TPA: dipeptidase [Bacteroidales bacterium]|nr:dipeptidase [Bacteroidales bacterium]
MKHPLTFIPAILLLGACHLQNNKNLSPEQVSRFHTKIITIDSHTDTPLELLNTGFNFGERHDPVTTGSKIDLPRLDQGGLDGVFFGVFVGQGTRDAEADGTATDKAYQILDSIDALVNRYPDRLELARRHDDIYQIVKEGKHAVFIGMENGYPVEGNISLIDSFYNRGVRYITLCHTKNNDICDSSTDDKGPEFHGLSDLGSEVVRRMNDLGIMIDISHASDETFYDVINLSKAPVIASHSCARALCDNPRNLDDDMLRKLADNGGVIQMCILSDYVQTPEKNPQRDSAKQAVVAKHGDYYTLDDAGKQAFLEDWHKVDVDFPPKLASVKQVVDHIDHIVNVAGIDHVGIGTDFDGGGGVSDCYDVSQLPNITTELLKRGYSGKDIRKIWGGNLLRVMHLVEKTAQKKAVSP